jgi:rhodanese-related sulfurtransferase
MAVKRVSPAEARDLMDKEGYVYVDVRSLPEFAAGHPQGAYNVPLMNLGPGGMTPNPEFLKVMGAFPRDAKLIVGCKAGGRSARAASMLESAGYTGVVDQRLRGRAGSRHRTHRRAGLASRGSARERRTAARPHL